MSNQIALIVGSLRKGSYTRKVARALTSLAPPDLKFSFVEIGHLPLYNQDFDDQGNPPSQWIEFRNQIKRFDGILFATPEYNRSIPGVLKNAIDVGSRPYGKSAWEGKPGAVISVSPGDIGGFGANHHLRQSMVFLNMPCMQQPECYIGGASQLFNDQGELQSRSTRDFLKAFVDAYAVWVESFVTQKLPMSA